MPVQGVVLYAGQAGCADKDVLAKGARCYARAIWSRGAVHVAAYGEQPAGAAAVRVSARAARGPAILGAQQVLINGGETIASVTSSYTGELLACTRHYSYPH
jgi:hypothetical protein